MFIKLITVNVQHIFQKILLMFKQFTNNKLGLMHTILQFLTVMATKVQHLYCTSIEDWDSLPNSLKSIQNNNKFKYEVKKFLHLQNQNID